MLDVKQCDMMTGGSSEVNPPPREVLYGIRCKATESHTDTAFFPVGVTPLENPNIEQGLVLTRENNPHKEEHAKKIIQEVTIGPDVTQDQCQTIQELLKEYADCFVLSTREVNAIPGAIHKLNIPEGATFCTKIPLRSYNQDQQAFINAKVDEMLEAGIICTIHPREVCFIAQTVLVQKAHDGQGLSIKELKHKVNEQCLEHRLPGEFEIPPMSEQNQNQSTKQNTPIKWLMCQDFGGINKVTEVAPATFMQNN